MVLTEEWERQIYPAATLEANAIEAEKLYYQINPAAVVPKPVSLNADYPNNNGIPNPGNSQPQANSTSMYRLNAATGDKMGLGIMLKVMSGDTVSILGKSFWHNNAQTTPDNNYQIPLNDLLSALTGIGTILNGKGISTTILGTQPITPGALQELLNNVPQNGSAPKAYINWILLDEQLKPVTNNSGFDGVDAQSEIVKTHTRAVNINRNGYPYVYASNQSNLDVFFDNLQVVHSRGPLLEETHYYPFGLTMAGISSKAAGKMENRKLYNGIEHTTELGLNHYDAFYRTLDPQVGRFMQIDPETDSQESESPYASMGNNPISNVDPLGDFKTRFGAWWYKLWHGGKVGRNNEGEYFVSKATQTTSTEDGSVTVGVSVTYGKGRNALSSAAERMQAQSDRQTYEDRMVNLGVWQRHETVQQANEATIQNSVNALLPTGFRAGTTVINFRKPLSPISNFVSKIINKGQQGKHIVGDANFKDGRSILTENAQELLDAFHAGTINSSQAINNAKTRVDFGKIIGNYKNPETGQLIPTTRGIIHNGNKGAHIVPSAPY
jgi:RHS repeat-associated protein